MTLFTKELKYCPIPIAFILIFIIISTFISDHEYYGAMVGLSAVIMGLIVMWQAFMIAQSTKQKRMIPLSYVCLSIAYMAYAVAELTWFILDLQGIGTYPSIADHIYSVYFMFSLAHVFLTYRYFVRKTRKKEIFIMLGILGIILCGYSYHVISLESDAHMAIFGGIFVTFAAVLLTGTGLVVYKLRNTKLFGAWALIGIAIIIGASGDLWYYPLDLLGEYEYGHPVDVIWMASDAILIFALNTHRKLI